MYDKDGNTSVVTSDKLYYWMGLLGMMASYNLHIMCVVMIKDAFEEQVHGIQIGGKVVNVI